LSGRLGADSPTGRGGCCCATSWDHHGRLASCFVVPSCAKTYFEEASACRFGVACRHPLDLPRPAASLPHKPPGHPAAAGRPSGSPRGCQRHRRPRGAAPLLPPILARPACTSSHSLCAGCAGWPGRGCAASHRSAGAGDATSWVATRRQPPAGRQRLTQCSVCVTWYQERHRRREAAGRRHVDRPQIRDHSMSPSDLGSRRAIQQPTSSAHSVPRPHGRNATPGR